MSSYDTGSLANIIFIFWLWFLLLNVVMPVQCNFKNNHDILDCLSHFLCIGYRSVQPLHRYDRGREFKMYVWNSHPWHNVHTKCHKFPSSHSLVIKFLQTVIPFEEVRLEWFRSGQVWLLMHMRRGSCTVAPLFYLTSSSHRHVDITEFRNLKFIRLEQSPVA
jgi:hypothetical protein